MPPFRLDGKLHPRICCNTIIIVTTGVNETVFLFEHSLPMEVTDVSNDPWRKLADGEAQQSGII